MSLYGISKARPLGKMAKTPDKATALQHYPSALGPKKFCKLRHSVKPQLAACIPAMLRQGCILRLDARELGADKHKILVTTQEPGTSQHGKR